MADRLKRAEAQASPVQEYNGCFLVHNSETEIDLVDKVSGKWIVCKSIRHAKWTATVWARLQTQFR